MEKLNSAFMPSWASLESFIFIKTYLMKTFKFALTLPSLMFAWSHVAQAQEITGVRNTKAELGPASVEISSNYGQTYMKSTSPSGDSKSVPNTDPPAYRVPSPKGTFDLATIRRVSDSKSGSYSWFGYGVFTANPQNLDAPVEYSWDISPSSFVNWIAETYPKYSSGGRVVDFGPEERDTGYTTMTEGLRPLGGTSNATTVKVNAETPSIIVQSSPLVINWHYPYENFHLVGIDENKYHEWFQPVDYQRPTLGYVEGEGPDNLTWKITQNTYLGDWGDAASTALGLASSLPSDGGSALLLAGLGLVAGQLSKELEQPSSTLTSTLTMFKESIRLSNSHRVGLDGEPADSTVFLPAGVTDASQYNEVLLIEPLKVVHYDSHRYKYDSYNSSGYDSTVLKRKLIMNEANPVSPAGIFIKPGPITPGTPPE